MLSLSLCMIVKNEERCILRCLESVKDIVTQYIIVDTGSTDKTVELVDSFKIKYPALGVQIHHYEWKNDFSAARNFSLSFATEQYILTLDADEYFQAADIPKIRTLLLKIKNAKRPYFVDCKVINLKADVNGEKMFLFPNHLDIRFSRKIHETPVESAAAIPGAKFIKAKFKLYHDGYNSDLVDPIEKRKRNLKILSRAIKEDPNDIVSTYYFARDYFLIDPIKSVDLLRRVEPLLENEPFWKNECRYYFELYSSYLKKSGM